jgi:cytochrome c oxidase cbb3-type subunit 3
MNKPEKIDTEIDAVTGIETTGHEWDGIKELNYPMPRWWLWTFYACIVFAIGYTIVYPAWPGINGATKGLFGWSSRGDVGAELQAVADSRAGLATKLVNTELAQVANDPDLLQFAIAAGGSAFKVNCSQCHGSGAAGGDIYPNLVDDDWIWGGTVEDIAATLRHGVRYEPDPDTRYSEMPGFGRDGLLTRDEISDVAWYVRKMSAQDTDEEAAARGATVFAEQCTACHGENGEGIRELGGPKLNDAIWLYGGSHAEIAAQITNPKQGRMPAWGGRLGDLGVKQLALYVHSLGGGE